MSHRRLQTGVSSKEALIGTRLAVALSTKARSIGLISCKKCILFSQTSQAYNFCEVTCLFRNATRCVPTNDGAMCQNDACFLSVSCRVKPAMTRAHFDTPPIFSDNSFVLRHIRATGDSRIYSTYMMPNFIPCSSSPINGTTSVDATNRYLQSIISVTVNRALQCSQTIRSYFYHLIAYVIIIQVTYYLISQLF